LVGSGIRFNANSCCVIPDFNRFSLIIRPILIRNSDFSGLLYRNNTSAPISNGTFLLSPPRKVIYCSTLSHDKVLSTSSTFDNSPGSNKILAGEFIKSSYSEDPDFDCSGFSKDEFDEMAGSVLQFLKRSGFNAEIKMGDESKLSAWRCNIFFPGFLFELGLTGHREERFLIKIETDDQQLDYRPVIANFRRAGFFFPVPVSSDNVLCSMKISAMLTRMKGKHFYDVIFLLGFTVPDYNILSQRFGTNNLGDLKQHVNNMLKSVDLNKKRRDFEHLLFNPGNSSRILHIADFIDEL